MRYSIFLFVLFTGVSFAQNLDSLNNVSFYENEYTISLKGNQLNVFDHKINKTSTGVLKRVPVDFDFRISIINTHCFALGDTKRIKQWAEIHDYYVWNVSHFVIKSKIELYELIPMKKWECPKDTVFIREDRE